MRFSNVGNLHFVRAAQVPLPPPANRAKVDVVDVGMAVVPLPKPLDEVQMGFQDDGIIHVGNWERSLGHRTRQCNSLPPTSLSHFGWYGRLEARGAAHDPKRQFLARVVGFLQHLVEELRVELPRLRLQFSPSPAGVMDRRRNPPGRLCPACSSGGMSPTRCQGWPGFRRFPLGSLTTCWPHTRPPPGNVPRPSDGAKSTAMKRMVLMASRFPGSDFSVKSVGLRGRFPAGKFPCLAYLSKERRICIVDSRTLFGIIKTVSGRASHGKPFQHDAG